MKTYDVTNHLNRLVTTYTSNKEYGKLSLNYPLLPLLIRSTGSLLPPFLNVVCSGLAAV